MVHLAAAMGTSPLAQPGWAISFPSSRWGAYDVVSRAAQINLHLTELRALTLPYRGLTQGCQLQLVVQSDYCRAMYRFSGHGRTWWEFDLLASLN